MEWIRWKHWQIRVPGECNYSLSRECASMSASASASASTSASASASTSASAYSYSLSSDYQTSTE